ncbi:MAG: hypothetical protein FJZ01_10170 [Candidatus Sericytochromatia bacterium]|nr:hypothetical protein [Candidatus Tanganyikabacteria bacterium]
MAPSISAAGGSRMAASPAPVAPTPRPAAPPPAPGGTASLGRDTFPAVRRATPTTLLQLPGDTAPLAPKSPVPRDGAAEAVLPEVQEAIRDVRKIAGTPGKVKSIADTAHTMLKNATDGAGAADDAATPPAKVGTGFEKGVKTGLGVLGVVGGTLQTATGVRELANGDTADGVKDVTAGSLNTAAGVAGLAGKLRVAGPLGGAASMVSGGYDIYQGIEKGDTEKAVVGGVKALGGGLLVASAVTSGTIVGAPAGAVLAAAGGAVLLGATAWENRHAIAGAAKWAGGKVASGAKKLAEKAFSGW